VQTTIYAGCDYGFFPQRVGRRLRRRRSKVKHARVCVYVCVCLPTRTCVMVGRSEVRRQSTDSYKKNKCWEKNYVHITALKTRSATKGPRGLLFSVRFNWKFQSLKICHRLYAYIIYIRYTCCYMCYYSVYI